MGEKYIRDFDGEIGRKTYVEYQGVYGRVILNALKEIGWEDMDWI